VVFKILHFLFAKQINKEKEKKKLRACINRGKKKIKKKCGTNKKQQKKKKKKRGTAEKEENFYITVTD
jgi:hypothetical protein